MRPRVLERFFAVKGGGEGYIYLCVSLVRCSRKVLSTFNKIHARCVPQLERVWSRSFCGGWPTHDSSQRIVKVSTACGWAFDLGAGPIALGLCGGVEARAHGTPGSSRERVSRASRARQPPYRRAGVILSRQELSADCLSAPIHT